MRPRMDFVMTCTLRVCSGSWKQKIDGTTICVRAFVDETANRNLRVAHATTAPSIARARPDRRSAGTIPEQRDGLVHTVHPAHRVLLRGGRNERAGREVERPRRAGVGAIEGLGVRHDPIHLALVRVVGTVSASTWPTLAMVPDAPQSSPASGSQAPSDAASGSDAVPSPSAVPPGPEPGPGPAVTSASPSVREAAPSGRRSRLVGNW